jgi:hypothetical protein
LARLFYGSVVAGIVLFILAAGVFPLPQNQRYRSTISVIPDGGREEAFVIQWPDDRIQPLDATVAAPLVRAGSAVVMLEAAAEGQLVGPSAEIFRLRDVAGNVIGLASRSTSRRPTRDGAAVQGTDWMLLLPSRGTLFMTQTNSRDVAPRVRGAGGAAAVFVPAVDAPGFWAAGNRLRVTGGPGPAGEGQVVGGSEEFAGMRGTFDESWELEEVSADGSTRGQIKLVTRVEAAHR